MRTVKIIFASIVLCFIGLTAYAEGGYKLLVKLTSEQVDTFALNVRPVVTFDGEYVHIKTDEVHIDSAYVYDKVDKFYFDVIAEDVIDSTDVEPIVIDEVEELPEETKSAGFSFAYDGRYAQIKGLGSKGQVAVFSVDGKRMQPKTVATSTTVTISMFELPTGIYIIRAGDRSIKIIRK